jgi:hypothetical protein
LTGGILITLSQWQVPGHAPSPTPDEALDFAIGLAVVLRADQVLK